MIKMDAKVLLEIIRPFNCLMAAFGVFIGYTIALGRIYFGAPVELGAAMIAAFLVCAAGMATNDVFDAGIDAKQHPKKPIPSGRISKKNALLFSSTLFIFANLIALYLLPLQSLAISFSFTILLILYSRFLAKAKYIGNWVVAAGTAFTLVFGASLVQLYSVVSFFAFSALFANVAREIVKDIEDLKQDNGFKVSLPMKAGIRASALAAALLLLAAIILGYAPFFIFNFGGAAFLLLLSIASIGFAYSARLSFGKNYAGAQRALKIFMLVALVSFLAGVF